MWEEGSQGGTVFWVTRSSWSASWGGAATCSPVQDWAWRLELADCKYFTEVLFSGNYFNMIQCFLFCLILSMSLRASSFPCCHGRRASIPIPSAPFLLVCLLFSVAVSRCILKRCCCLIQWTKSVSLQKNGWCWTCPCEAFETTKLIQTLGVEQFAELGSGCCLPVHIPSDSWNWSSCGNLELCFWDKCCVLTESKGPSVQQIYEEWLGFRFWWVTNSIYRD